MNHHSERVWSLGVGRGAVCVWVVGLGGRWYVVLQWLCVESAEEERDLESDEKRNGKDRRRGSGHRSLSQLTQPSGVALSFSLFSSASLTPSAPHTHTPTHPATPPMLLSSSLILASFLCGDRRREISWRINHGSSFHCRAEDTEGNRSWRWRGQKTGGLWKVEFRL